MGYTIIIGELEVDYDQDERYIRITAKHQKHEHAPAFGDPTDHENQRWPSYRTWSDFLSEVGLSELFYDENRLTLGGHPGAVPLTRDWAEKVHLARVQRERKSTSEGKTPGYWPKKPDGKHEWDVCDDGTKDPTLARLIWLDYWCTWAVDNCKRPVIANS